MPPKARAAHLQNHNGGPWSKGLTKETHPSLRATSEKVSKALRGRKAPWARENVRRLQERPEVREKMTRTVRAQFARGERQPFGGRKWGNGKPAHPAERRAHQELKGMGFKLGVIVAMGKGSERPHHYKLDLANTSKKIAVEIDGSSHRGRASSDQRKDARLGALGWVVLRFLPTVEASLLRSRVTEVLVSR